VSLLECRKRFQIEDLEKVRNENLKEVWKLSWKGVLKKGLLKAVLRSMLAGILGEMSRHSKDRDCHLESRWLKGFERCASQTLGEVVWEDRGLDSPTCCAILRA
jgi:hypothetical protein